MLTSEYNMKIESKYVVGSCAAFLLVVGSGFAEELTLDECPEAVKTVIVDHVKDGRLDEIERFNIEGKTIYIAEVDMAQDRDLKVYVSGSAELLKTVREVRLSEVPEPVRSAVLELEGSPDDLEQVNSEGITTYNVEMERTGEPDLEVVLSAKGAVIRQTEKVED